MSVYFADSLSLRIPCTLFAGSNTTLFDRFFTHAPSATCRCLAARCRGQLSHSFLSYPLFMIHRHVANPRGPAFRRVLRVFCRRRALLVRAYYEAIKRRNWILPTATACAPAPKGWLDQRRGLGAASKRRSRSGDVQEPVVQNGRVEWDIR